MIRYFPKSELEPQQEINAILDRLYPILEYIYMVYNDITYKKQIVNHSPITFINCILLL